MSKLQHRSVQTLILFRYAKKIKYNFYTKNIEAKTITWLGNVLSWRKIPNSETGFFILRMKDLEV